MIRRFLALLLFFCANGYAEPSVKALQLVEAGRAQIGKTISYDGAYVPLRYPMGDVPIERGVCTDVVVRAFRALGIDLQKELREDMRGAFRSYPRLWGLRSPDPNIDHRRVPNLMHFFARRGKERRVSSQGADYSPGDIVAWRLPDGRPHIGLVSNEQTNRSPNVAQRPLVIHNIGAGAAIEDRLFDFQIIGHYRYF